jgi:hypothetical protein
MRWLLNQISAATVRWLTQVIIVAICAAWGFAPSTWFASLITEPPPWIFAPWTRLGVVLVGTVIVVLIFLWDRRAKQKSIAAISQSEWPLSDAIDYVVNDSTAILRQPPQPYIENDRRIVHWGVQHSDALAKLNEKLNTGALAASGFRQIKSHIANQFELQKRPIPGSYWLVSQLHPVTSLSNTDKEPQTMAIPGTHAPDRLEWTGITVPMATVKQLWPQQSWARGAWKWILRRPRIEPRASDSAQNVKSDNL